MKKLLFLIAIVFLLSSFSSKKITWVAIGDSITYLNEHTDETGNRITKGYMTRVVENCQTYIILTMAITAGHQEVLPMILKSWDW